jgi:hypothetical protein
MLKVILCFLFLNVLGSPPSTYYLYEEKPIKLNDVSFQRYIIPQLRAMSQEYYHLLRKLHPLNNPLIEIKLKIIDMNIDYQRFLLECRKNTVDCLGIVEKLYKKSRDLDSLILKLKSNQLNFKNKGMDELPPLIKLLHSIDEIAGLVYSLTHKLEQMKITLNTSYFEFHDSSFDMNKIFHNMDLASETILTALLDKGIQNDFNFARTTFFKNIERFVVQEKNKSYLISQLEQLNLSWNTFHMKMTKGNHQPTREVKNLIKIMHNRWNSCLKIILRD